MDNNSNGKRISGLSAVREFFMRNMWMIWIVTLGNSVLLIVVGLFVSSYVGNAADRMESAVVKMENGIVMLDLLGRPIISSPQKLTPIDPRYKKSITNYVQMYGIYDWATLTDTFTKKVRNADDAYKTSEKMRDFVENFFKDKKCQAYRDFVSYITKNVFLMNQDNLPERIVFSSSSISNFTSTNGSFTARIVFQVQVNIYDGNTETFTLREGQITVDTIGTLKASEGTPINPLGIKFTDAFKPSIIKKRSK